MTKTVAYPNVSFLKQKNRDKSDFENASLVLNLIVTRSKRVKLCVNVIM